MKTQHGFGMDSFGTVVLAGLLGLAITGCGSHATKATGTVVGQIEACSGLPEPTTYVGGTVLALRGSIAVKQVDGYSRQVLPTIVAGRQVVPNGGKYSFVLAPGPYIIDLPHYIGGNVGSDVAVVIKPGAAIQIDLPNECK